MLAAAPRRVEPPREVSPDVPAAHDEVPAAQDNVPVKSVIEPVPAPLPAMASPPPATEAVPAAAPPVFRARQDIPKPADRAAASAIPAVIPIIRAPDDPGIDDEPALDEFAEQNGPVQGQAGGWRGFLSRWAN